MGGGKIMKLNEIFLFLYDIFRNEGSQFSDK